jgi:hypothetical protein
VSQAQNSECSLNSGHKFRDPDMACFKQTRNRGSSFPDAASWGTLGSGVCLFPSRCRPHTVSSCFLTDVAWAASQRRRAEESTLLFGVALSPRHDVPCASTNSRAARDDRRNSPRRAYDSKSHIQHSVSPAAEVDYTRTHDAVQDRPHNYNNSRSECCSSKSGWHELRKIRTHCALQLKTNPS